MPPLPGPALDTSGATWHGHFPGLGAVWVADDGTYGVDPEPGPDLEGRAQALDAGWAEPLSWHRRGHLLLGGLTLVHDPAHGCLLMTPSGTETSLLLPALLARGWSVLSDSPTPVLQHDDALLAQPRPAPVLVARRAAGGAVLARTETDAAVLDVPRHDRTARLAGVAHVVRVEVGTPPVQHITGRERLVTARALPLGGVFRRREPEAEPATRRAHDLALGLRLSALPAVRFAVRDGSAPDHDAEADAVTSWWEDLGADA